MEWDVSERVVIDRRLFILGMAGLFTGCTSPQPGGDIHGPLAGISFRECAAAAGLDYKWNIPGQRPLNILQTIGNGCAFLDYNGDGNLDILLVGEQLALYEGDGHGNFRDVTGIVGLDKYRGHFLGCAVGDYDNDGWPDIYLSGYRTGLLLHNQDGKKFEDVTAQSGIPPQPWGTSAAWVQTQADSRLLDLYVCNYCDFDGKSRQLCPDSGIMSSCGPRFYKPIPNRLFRNNGSGRFHDVTHLANAAATGRALGVACADYNHLGAPALAIANDEEPGDLLYPHHLGGSLQYANIGQKSNVAFDGNGNVHGGMGINWGDYDNDGRLDLLVATFYNEEKCLYHNQGDGSFADASMQTGVGAYGMQYVTFGACFLDANNNGWLDIVLSNGHVQDNIHKIDPALTYREPTIFLANSGVAPIYYHDASNQTGFSKLPRIVGRGLAVGDYDNDGRQDLLVVDSEGSPLLLHNETTNAGHWLGIDLQGSECNHDGYGALVYAEFGGRTLLRHCHSDGSYLSACDRRVHFGLGETDTVESLTIKWPDGKVDQFRNVKADRYVRIRQGHATIS